MDSYISPKTKKGLSSNIHGKGFFATDFIKKDEVVAIKKGINMTREEMAQSKLGGGVGLQIADNLYISPSNIEDFNRSMIYINYSCDPNLGMKSNDTVVAFRDINPGEELVLDYAMFVNDDSSFECDCKTKECRKTVTGKDWAKQELQEKYKGYFTDYIQSKIENK